MEWEREGRKDGWRKIYGKRREKLKENEKDGVVGQRKEGEGGAKKRKEG